MHTATCLLLRTTAAEHDMCVDQQRAGQEHLLMHMRALLTGKMVPTAGTSEGMCYELRFAVGEPLLHPYLKQYHTHPVEYSCHQKQAHLLQERIHVQLVGKGWRAACQLHERTYHYLQQQKEEPVVAKAWQRDQHGSKIC